MHPQHAVPETPPLSGGHGGSVLRVEDAHPARTAQVRAAELIALMNAHDHADVGVDKWGLARQEQSHEEVSVVHDRQVYVVSPQFLEHASRDNQIASCHDTASSEGVIHGDEMSV
jgi:hypothetical protein